MYKDYQNGDVFVDEVLVGEEEIRYYYNDGELHSATYMREGKHFDLIFPYMEQFYRIFDLKKDIHHTLLIGGAGYSFPKYVLSRHMDVSMDVVDTDSMVYQTAKQFFFLDELIQTYSLEETKRLNPITMDGRTYLVQTDKLYDVIFDDAFVGQDAVYDLLTKQAAQLVRSHLKEDGFFVANIPDYEKVGGSSLIEDVLTTFKTVFEYVKVVRAVSTSVLFRSQNLVLFASNAKFELEDAYDVKEGTILEDEK